MVLLGDGTGHFAAPMDFAVGNGATAIGLGDLNSDGRADAVTSNYFSGTASVLLNQTRSGFDLSPCRLGCKQHITLTKDFVPNPNDPNVTVDLRINDALVAGRVSDGGTSGPIGVEPGIYVVSETGTALKRYIGTVLCTGESSAQLPAAHADRGKGCRYQLRCYEPAQVAHEQRGGGQAAAALFAQCPRAWPTVRR